MKLVQLGEVASIDRAAASEAECRDLPYVGLESIEKDTGAFAPGFEAAPQALLATKYRFTRKHVLYGKLRPYLNKVALPSFDGVCTTEILPILPRAGVLDRVYLWAALLTPRFVRWASANVEGANLPRLSPQLLAKWQIPVPPLAEQKRISAILSKADRLRRLRRYALKLSEGYLQAVFLEMFGDQTRMPGRTLSELKVRFVYGTSAKCQAEPNGLPVLRIPNIVNREIDLQDLKYARLPARDVQKLSLGAGDLIFVRTNGNPDYVGRCAVFDLRGTYLFASYLIRARLDLDMLDPWFVAAYLRTEAGRQAMAPYIRTTAGQSNIGIEGLGQMPVPVPPPKLQRAYSEIVHRHERLRAQQSEALRQAERLFETLLHRAFLGEL